MRDIGIEPKIDIHKGYKYYYPNSNKSTSVYYALLDKIVANDIDILYDTFVKDIRINNGRFNVILNDDQLTFDKIVIATGGNTYKNTGSDGNIYKILEKLGHKIIKPLPALCGFTYEDKELLSLKGVRVDAKAYAKVWSSDKNGIEKEFIECGEIQFTQNGISGIPIMNLSRLVNRYIDDGRRADLSIDLSPTTKNNDLLNLTEYLNDRKEKIYYKKARDFLCGYIPDEIADKIIRRCGIIDKSVSNLNTSDIVKIAKLILDFGIENIKIPSIDNAQITIGGVDTNEVDGASLESKIIKNMYIIGEALDVDGKCGGYNLQFAYSSAATVAKKFK